MQGHNMVLLNRMSNEIYDWVKTYIDCCFGNINFDKAYAWLYFFLFNVPKQKLVFWTSTKKAWSSKVSVYNVRNLMHHNCVDYQLNYFENRDLCNIFL